jgi:hypothetical protein
MQAEPAIPYFLGILENEPYVRSRNDIAGVLGGFQRERAAYILPDLLALIPTESGEYALRAISGIQQNCQFYNYEIFHKQLPPVVSPQPSGATVTYTIDSEIVQIIENNHDTVIGTQNLKTTED